MVELYPASYGAKLTGSSSAPWYLVISKETQRTEIISARWTFVLSNEGKTNSFPEQEQLIIPIHCPEENKGRVRLFLRSTVLVRQLTELLFYLVSIPHYEDPLDPLVSLLVEKLFLFNQSLLIPDPSLVKLLERMHEQVEEQLTVADFCQVTHQSPASLTRRCHEVFGRSPMQVFHQIKCREARKRLEETDLSIQEVARGLGFRNVSRFSETFKRFEGITPKEVRKQQRR